MRTSRFVVLVVLSLTAIGFAEEQEKKIERADLPAAVAKTVAAQSQGATSRAFRKRKKMVRPITKPR